MSPKPSLTPMYAAAYGFNTDRRVKPVHFATGFFVALLGKKFRNEWLNYVVAFSEGKEQSGTYGLPDLHAGLVAIGALSSSLTVEQLHALRLHLRCLAANDDAVYPSFGEKAGFGCDYTAGSKDLLSRSKDNDGFCGYFAYSVLRVSAEGRRILEWAEKWLTTGEPTWRQVFQPLLDEDPEADDTSDRYDRRMGELSAARLRRVSKRMLNQTQALAQLCDSADRLFATETRLRFLMIGLSLWLLRYLADEGLESADRALLLADVSGEAGSRIRAQSRWSYARLREQLIQGFTRFAEAGRFEDCQEAWEYVLEQQEGRPRFEEFYRELTLRSGIAQPRASRVMAKHFEPQPDTLRVLVMSVLSDEEGLIPLEKLLDRLSDTWGLVVGGRAGDADLLLEYGYGGLDRDQDLRPNAEAFIALLRDLGLATPMADGLVMCHSKALFS